MGNGKNPLFSKIVATTKLWQSQGPHRFSGLSTVEPLLVSYLTNKVGFGLISANIWLPDTVLYREVDFL